MSGWLSEGSTPSTRSRCSDGPHLWVLGIVLVLAWPVASLIANIAQKREWNDQAEKRIRKLDEEIAQQHRDQEAL